MCCISEKNHSEFWVRRDITMSISKFIDEKYGGHAVTRVIKILLFGPPIYVGFIYIRESLKRNLCRRL